jgi:hypothetical protein
MMMRNNQSLSAIALFLSCTVTLSFLRFCTTEQIFDLQLIFDPLPNYSLIFDSAPEFIQKGGRGKDYQKTKDFRVETMVMCPGKWAKVWYPYIHSRVM